MRGRPLTAPNSPTASFAESFADFCRKLAAMKPVSTITVVLAFMLTTGLRLPGQSINSGTLRGSVTDQTGGTIAGARVVLRNAISGYEQSTTTDATGAWRFNNIPLNRYHVEATASGFSPAHLDVEVRSSLPVTAALTLPIGNAETSVTVETGGTNVEIDTAAHVDVDRSLIQRLPSFDPGAGLSKAIVNSSGGMAEDGNGFFHPQGDHAQVSFVIDGQPISDQQSKVFSTQLPTSAVQSMELITGSPNAEFGDKTSLVAQITTRSALGAGRLFGNIESSYGSFGTAGGSVAIGYGNAKAGNFLALDGVRSGRFLDTPEFRPFHDRGNNQTIFDRFDFQPSAKDVFHLNLFAARNWIQIPNSLDQLAQDQRQRVLTWSIAPGYQRTFSANTLLTINPYVRKDQFNYYASNDPLNDTPATQSQNRQLLNWGVKADVSTTKGRHNLKYGIDLKQTRLLENFGFGITDPGFNAPCLDSSGASIANTALNDPSQCAGSGFQPNPGFSTGLATYDLTRNGNLFQFHATGNITQYAFYVQDGITLGDLLVNVGFRVDRYDGVSSKTEPEPRLGLAYHVKKSGTVLRAAYARTFETPFNENLLLSAATGAGGLTQNVFGSNSVSIQPGSRNQFNTGLQQSLGRFLLLDADYFWKYTHNAYDFGTLLNTTITFPIAWRNSKIDGVTGRLSTVNLRGFQAFWTFGHSRARYFPPEVGGLVPQGADLSSGVFRIDHDQAFQSTVNLRYQRPKNAEWISLTYRYDSGLVVSGIPDADFAIGNLSPNQQATIGLACNGVYATPTSPIVTCDGNATSRLLTLPQGGQESNDHNPDRVKPRNIFNLGIGTDNLTHGEGWRRITASMEIANLTNQVALYNFLSTFSGTHFLGPRSVVFRLGIAF